MAHNEVFLDSYSLQKDMRIRLPKQILSNLPVTVGTEFNIYFNPVTDDIILKISATDKIVNHMITKEE